MSALQVLVAEDSIINQKVTLILLERRGHHVTIVNNGREALAAMKRSAFDVVLMDVQMPEMNGFEATAAIRARETATGSHIPIIAMTAQAMQGDREACLAAGMDDYLAKPFRAEVLYQTVERAVSIGRPARSSPQSTQPGGAPATQCDEPDFDPQSALHRFSHYEDDLREVIAIFLDELGPAMGRLQNAVESRDLGKVQAEAHTLKGSASNLSAAVVARIARRLEDSARGANLEMMDQSWADLQAAAARVTIAMQRYRAKPAT